MDPRNEYNIIQKIDINIKILENYLPSLKTLPPLIKKRIEIAKNMGVSFHHLSDMGDDFLYELRKSKLIYVGGGRSLCMGY